MSAASPPAAKVNVFFSYSHRDEELRDELSKHLSLLRREQVIGEWHDRRITPGDEWATEIDHHLDSADIILLLVSSDFLDSNYCFDIEVGRAMERHEAGLARVIPVLLRSVEWGRAPFAKLQSLPKDGRAVTSWPNRDEAFLNVAEGIRRAVGDLLRRRVEHLVLKLDRAEKLENWPNAIDLGERILGVVPDDESVRARTAVAYVNRWSGRVTRAMDELGVVGIKRKRSEDQDTFLKILEEMRHDVDRAIELDSKRAEFYFIRGSLTRFASFHGFRLRRPYVPEEEDFARAVELDPGRPEHHFALGRSLSNEDVERAYTSLLQAVDRGYDERVVRYVMGWMFEDDADTERALAEYERAASLGHPIARLRVDRLRVEQGRGQTHPRLKK